MGTSKTLITMARIPFLLLLLAVFATVVSAGAPIFCKCTCFKNSTIIPLGPEHQQSDDSQGSFRRSANLFENPFGSPSSRTASTSCSECTKNFCLSQGIDICEDAEEEDVMTLCFQRDSNKDKIIVWGFIVGTVGLLGWAAFKKVMTWRQDRSFARQDVNYAAVSAGQR